MKKRTELETSSFLLISGTDFPRSSFPSLFSPIDPFCAHVHVALLPSSHFTRNPLNFESARRRDEISFSAGSVRLRRQRASSYIRWEIYYALSSATGTYAGSLRCLAFRRWQTGVPQFRLMQCSRGYSLVLVDLRFRLHGASIFFITNG